MKHSNTRHSMRWYRRSMHRRRRSAGQRQQSRGVTGGIGNCGVGVTPQMCNRVTNHGDWVLFPDLAPSVKVIAVCRVGITTKMCNRVTNPTDMVFFPDLLSSDIIIYFFSMLIPPLSIGRGIKKIAPLPTQLSFFKVTIYLQFLTCPCKKHTCCIFMWFTFQFRPYKKCKLLALLVFITM